jgi:hypothetical protein
VSTTASARRSNSAKTTSAMPKDNPLSLMRVGHPSRAFHHSVRKERTGPTSGQDEVGPARPREQRSNGPLALRAMKRLVSSRFGGQSMSDHQLRNRERVTVLERASS